MWTWIDALFGRIGFAPASDRFTSGFDFTLAPLSSPPPPPSQPLKSNVSSQCLEQTLHPVKHPSRQGVAKLLQLSPTMRFGHRCSSPIVRLTVIIVPQEPFFDPIEELQAHVRFTFTLLHVERIYARASWTGIYALLSRNLPTTTD